MVQILDAPVPQMVDQLVEVFQHFDIAVPEQVIDVPKVPQDRIAQRTAPRNSCRNSWWKCRRSRRPLAFQFSPYSKTSDLATEVFEVVSQDRVRAPPRQGGMGAAPVSQIPEKIADQDEVAAQVVDVPVTMQDKSQQSVPIVLKLCPRGLVTPVVPQRQVRTVQTVQHPRDSTVQFLGYGC